MTGRGWLDQISGDPEISDRLSEARQIKDMVRVEAACARALGQVGQVTPDMAEQAARAIEAAQIDTDLLARDAAVDGMPVPSLSRQLRAAVPDGLRAAVHKGLTSQDVMDTALVLAVRDCLEVFEARLSGIEGALDDLNARFCDRPLMARTRMQAALPVTVADRIALWKRPHLAQRERLSGLRPRLLVLQLGGPVGTRDSFGDHGDAIAQAMATELGLTDPGRAWHTDRGALAELGGWLSTLTGHLGKLGHDITLMAQQGIGAARLSGGGTSSAMAHKVNPVSAEILVSLARFTALQLSGLHLALDHEQERSGTAWTLEWLILPLMLVATGAALRHADAILAQLDGLGGDSAPATT